MLGATGTVGTILVLRHQAFKAHVAGCLEQVGADLNWLEWCDDDPRRVTMSSLLRKVAKRYDRPLVVAETSHIGSGRAM